MIVPSPAPVLTAVATALVTVMSLSLVGYRMLPRWVRPHRAWLRIPASLSVGATLIAAAVWTIGHVLGTMAAGVAVAALLSVSLTVARTWWRDLGATVRHLWLLVRSAPALAGGVIAIFTLLIVPQLLLPAISSDGLRYHLALPKLYLLEGRVLFYPWDVHAAMPQAAEMLYMLMMPFGGGEAAKILHATFFVGSLAVLALFVHHDRTSRRAAAAAALCLAATPAVLASAGVAFVDLFALFHLGVACLLVRFRCHPLVIGVVLAGALSTKWTAAPAVAALALLAICAHRRRRTVRYALLLATPIVLVVLPLTVRNAIATGDPFYPIGMGLVDRAIPGVSQERFDYVTQVHAEIPGPLGIPWGANVSGVQPDEVVGWHHLLGLIVAPLLIGSRRLRPAGVLIVSYLLIGLHYHPSSRLSMPLIWGLAAYEGVALARLRHWASIVAAVICAPALVVAAGVQLEFGRPLDYLRGRISRADVQRLAVPAADAAFFVNQLPVGGKVMALDFPAPYLFDRPWIAEGTANDPPLQIWLRAGASGDRLRAELRSRHVRYLVVTPGYGGGTAASLLPLAETPDQTAAVLDLRSHLHRMYSKDHVDVLDARDQ